MLGVDRSLRTESSSLYNNTTDLIQLLDVPHYKVFTAAFAISHINTLWKKKQPRRKRLWLHTESPEMIDDQINLSVIVQHYETLQRLIILIWLMLLTCFSLLAQKYSGTWSTWSLLYFKYNNILHALKLRSMWCTLEGFLQNKSPLFLICFYQAGHVFQILSWAYALYPPLWWP